MIENQIIIPISPPLLTWFKHHGRKDLPWQQHATPYHTWVSEIMLQQTQVNTVIPYYQRFIERFPEVHHLATAALDEVLHYWSGLGYYARARNLHRAAQQICEQYQGILPDDPQQLLALAGIGRSTAGAILALAFGQPHAILDGNVKRVLCRYHAIARWAGEPQTEKDLWKLAEAHTPQEQVRDYTQAIMDLGATICTRSQPHCPQCPLHLHCQAQQQGLQHRYPVAKPSKAIPIKTIKFLIIHTAHTTLLQQRPQQGIWGGLWSFPECHELSQANQWVATHCHIQQPHWQIGRVLRHTFTHFHLEITPLYLKLAQNVIVSAPQVSWYDLEHPPEYGLAAPVARLLAQLREQPPATRLELF
jgi:A/G-specific adenine glycosylase